MNQRKFLILFAIVIGFFYQCRVYDPDAALFWKESISLNESLDKQFFGTNTIPILQGMLQPEDESLLFSIDENKMVLALEAYKQNNSWKAELVRQSSAKPLFAMKTIYTKDFFGDEEIYKVQRFQDAIMGKAKPSVVFQGIVELIKEGPEGTKTQEFLCKSFDCDIQGTTLIYRFSQKTKHTYPAFYQKFSKRLSSMDFVCKGIPDGNIQASIVVSNRGEAILIQLPNPEFAKYWQAPKNIVLNLDAKVRGYGLTLSIQNMKYILSYKKSGSNENLSGGFRGIPESKIEGRFFYIIPQGVVNLFIPSDIESYLRKGIQLLTVGSTGEKGTGFQIAYGGEGKSSYYRYIGYTETYRKKFSLLGSRKPEEEEGLGNQKVFFRDLNEAFAADLNTKL